MPATARCQPVRGIIVVMMGRSCSCAMLLVLTLVCGGVCGGVCGDAAAQTPQQVLSDTADYCAELQLQVDQALAQATAAPPPEILTLSDDGQVMCRNGEIKGGIVRLRRALLALRRGP